MEYYVNKGKYIIPLDAVDASLMSFDGTIPKKVDDYKPLWSTDVLNLRNENSYYQIDMQEGPNESELSAAKGYVKLDTYICHICNLEVPQCYMKDHVDSSKHKMFLKFAQVAVDRLIRNLDQGCYKRKPIRSLYFCEVCICVVSINDEPRHLLSENHKNAVRKEAMFEKLLKLFTEGDDVFDEIFPVKNEKVDNKVSENLKSSSENKLPNNKEIVITPQTEFSLDDYLKTLNASTTSSHTLASINNEYYEISLKNGSVVKVEQNRFHGIVKIFGRRYQCKLCSDVFKNRDYHILSTKHMKKVSLPIKDKHCIRDLDDVKSHCILCNELIESYLVHTVCNTNHLERLSKLVSINEEYFETTTEAKTPAADLQERAIFEAELNNKIIKKTDVEASNNTKPEAKVWCKVCKVTYFHSDQFHANCRKKDSKVNKKHHFIKPSSQAGHYVCDVCFIQLNSQEVEDHIFDTEHIDRCQAMLADNNMYVVNDGQMYCNMCGVIIEKGNEIAHIFSVRHVPRVQHSTSEVGDEIRITTSESKDGNNQKCEDVKIDKKPEKLIDSKEYICKICNVKVPNSPKNISIHEKGAKHKKLLSNDNDNKVLKNNENSIYTNIQNKTYANNASVVAKTVELNKPIENEAANKLLEAIIPSVSCNIKEDKKLNMTSVSVPTMEKHVEEKTVEVPSKDIEQLNQNANDSVKENVFPLMEINAQENNAFCKICKVSVPNYLPNIYEHLYGNKHITILKKCAPNGLIVRDKMFYCLFCFIYLSPGIEETHIDSETHKRNFAETKVNKTKTKKITTVDGEFDVVRNCKPNNKPSASIPDGDKDKNTNDNLPERASE